ncbi:hypothetical protein DV515_00014686 [Chloebia gouldiae]|uniref:Leucine-rich repeat-containing protein 7 n=1 Tax=Chloebia gouldiae TaxID=44316 RepID=A0A3L8RXM2_CHLGU|nr:hypothetical protein DV515_00014686 [Chloebia gouldiae]
MTSKRKLIGRLVPCRCFRGEEEIVSVLDYSHCGLQQVPKEVFNFERTLEELYLDANQIEELPKVIHVLLGCQGKAWNVCPALGLLELLGTGGDGALPKPWVCPGGVRTPSSQPSSAPKGIHGENWESTSIKREFDGKIRIES